MRPRTRLLVLGMLVVAGLLTYAGWRLFWFLTDDACICFRYVSNALHGHGYVWNAAPFRPVEGYSCFLWVVLLELTWRVLGIAPPGAANTLSLLFSLGSLLLAGVMVLRLRWAPPLARHRLLILGLVLAGITLNRTFLTWTSSGLETALYNVLVLLWVYAALFVAPRATGRAAALSATAAALYLTRPDGLLYVAATAALVVPWRSPSRRRLLSCTPLLAVPAHFIWRRSFYGEWLPNTYFAKYTAPWPESGWRYAASFVLEYAWWIWLLAALLLVLRRARPAAGGAPPAASSRGAAPPDAGRGARRALVAGTLLAHFGYYTFVIGGDHFEYRVYSHLIVPLWVALAWLVNAARLRPRAALGWLAAALLTSCPLPWSHWALTHRLSTREETLHMRVPVATRWPAPLRFYARGFDRLQDWLIARMVCTRHQEHRVFYERMSASYPARVEEWRWPAGDPPVHVAFAVGVPGWTLPQVAILDLWGLNDHVIARHRGDRAGGPRFLAHERVAPRGYVECFRPNVELLEGRRIVVHPRAEALTAERIRACEQEWARRVRSSLQQ